MVRRREEDKTRQDKTRQEKIRRQNKRRQEKTRGEKRREDKARQYKTKEYKWRQDKRRQGKARQDKTRQDKRSKTELYMARSPPSEKEPSSDSSLCSDNTELEGEGRWVCGGLNCIGSWHLQKSNVYCGVRAIEECEWMGKGVVKLQKGEIETTLSCLLKWKETR